MQITGLLNPIIQLAKHAGEEIMAIYRRGETAAIQTKSDASPLTLADLAAHRIISAGLKELQPAWPILSEEDAIPAFAERQLWQHYWLIDPLDGTKEFIEQTNDFTVNIALIENHQPILGVVYVPALALCYFASKNGGAFKQIGEQEPEDIHAANWQGGTARVAASRRHGLTELQSFLHQLQNFTIVSRGSALKCCLVAEGKADIYPRLSPTSEWDIAAAQCIVEQAGGAIIDTKGVSLRYNNKDSVENPSFLAVGDNSFDWLQYLKE